MTTDSLFSVWVVGVGTLILSVLSTVFAVRSMGVDERTVAGAELFLFCVALGAIAAFFHGIIWVGIEKKLGTTFLSSTFNGIPMGIQAVLLSVSLTLPLVTLPALCQWTTGYELLRPRPAIVHVQAAMALVGGGIAAHLIMYGTNAPHIPGLKGLIYPPGKSVAPTVAIITELIYAIVYFGLMAVPYRLVIGTMNQQGTFWVVTFAFVWVFCVAGFILYIGLRAINDAEGVSLRGMLSAIVLEMTLMAAALM